MQECDKADLAAPPGWPQPIDAQPRASQPQSLYEAVGGEPAFRRIVARFYELVAVDKILRPLYPDADLGAAEERLRLYLIEHWGGPAAYTQLRGPSRLAARHICSASRERTRMPGCERCASPSTSPASDRRSAIASGATS